MMSTLKIIIASRSSGLTMSMSAVTMSANDVIAVVTAQSFHQAYETSKRLKSDKVRRKRQLSSVWAAPVFQTDSSKTPRLVPGPGRPPDFKYPQRADRLQGHRPCGPITSKRSGLRTGCCPNLTQSAVPQPRVAVRTLMGQLSLNLSNDDGTDVTNDSIMCVGRVGRLVTSALPLYDLLPLDSVLFSKK